MKTFALSLLPLGLLAFMITRHPDTGRQQHSTQYDGPYVLYRGDQVFVKYVLDDHGTKKPKVDSLPVAQRGSVVLNVATDEPGKTFTVQLKKTLENEENTFPDVKKLFIVSDIEGNFKAFRKLLLAHKIIDEQFNWTFEKGHLVLTGDFVDRGDMQTEVLWLIYALEEKAKAAGGYVHYILGNHEIMNMSNDLRYVHPKYMQNATLINESYLTLYSEHSELGRWLRTKNIMERIDNILFVHAGVSPALNRMDLSVKQVNKLARPFYPDTTYRYPDPQTDTLYGDAGPFWYRGYYYGDVRASQHQVDSTLSLYKVKRIATGHTVIADTISLLYNGKVINTDVHHLKGHSEGMLIDGGKYYRATAHGELFLVKD